ncbi:MAG: ATP-binding protein [Alphaproteobacteria bacterium]|nr:ATP-binding protein [Alphaproteobacteria bacterium]MBT5390331.1 ATP-binding protein [Alphaproteobacteria bacterium]
MYLIGRKKEQTILEKMLSSKEAEFVAIYGRRRVGKTYLIQQCLSQKGVYLECTGTKDGNLKTQLLNFTQSFSTTFYPGIPISSPKSWREAFELLTQEIIKHKNKKIILFFDELPWLATRKSKLLQNLDYFWNTQWSKLPQVKLIVCGSAASWMISHLINAKGGLHNRVTKTLLLEPFNLSETKMFLEKKKIKLSKKQVLDLYMVMGGIPYYLNHLDPTKSISQNINDMCFKKDGVLYGEFHRLFRSLFEAAELNLQIVKVIAQRHYGISFSELAQKVGKKVGGRLAERLDELAVAGFIQRFLPYGRKKRDHYYKVVDEYILFYFKWIADLIEGKELPKGTDYWTRISKSPAWYSWAGYSFENICYKHVDKIIHALGLENCGCFVSHWRYHGNYRKEEDGAQIDLLLDRDDDAITLCEIKYSSKPFIIDKSYAKNLMKKQEVFEKNIKTPKQIFLTMITVSGLKKNGWSEELVHHSVTLQDLF